MSRDKRKIKPLRYLIQGMEPEAKINLLFKLTNSGKMTKEEKVAAENLKVATIDHLVKGLDVSISAMLNSTEQSNLSAYLSVLNSKATLVEKIHEAKVYKDVKSEVEITIQLTNFRSKIIQKAIFTHLVEGKTITESAKIHNTQQSNLSRNLLKLKKKSELVEEINEFKHI